MSKLSSLGCREGHSTQNYKIGRSRLFPDPRTPIFGLVNYNSSIWQPKMWLSLLTLSHVPSAIRVRLFRFVNVQVHTSGSRLLFRRTNACRGGGVSEQHTVDNLWAYTNIYLQRITTSITFMNQSKMHIHASTTHVNYTFYFFTRMAGHVRFADSPSAGRLVGPLW